MEEPVSGLEQEKGHAGGIFARPVGDDDYPLGELFGVGEVGEKELQIKRTPEKEMPSLTYVVVVQNIPRSDAARVKVGLVGEDDIELSEFVELALDDSHLFGDLEVLHALPRARTYRVI